MSEDFLSNVKYRLNRLEELTHSRGYSLGCELEENIKDMQSCLPNIEASIHTRNVVTEHSDRKNSKNSKNNHPRVFSSKQNELRIISKPKEYLSLKTEGVLNQIDNLNRQIDNIANKVKSSSNEIKVKDSENAKLKESIMKLMGNMEEHSELYEDKSACSICSIF